MLDPFRIQVLSLALDSQAVLTLLGLVLAGPVFAAAARRAGLAAGAADWLDVVVAAFIGARLVWVLLHLGYYLRGPLQALVITDGGLHPLGFALGLAWAVLRLQRRSGLPWRSLAAAVALAALAALLFERAGCALTTCGGGALTDVPWALQRGAEFRHPVALYQALPLAAALVLLAGRRYAPSRTVLLAAGAPIVSQAIGLWAGRGPDGLVAGVAVLALYAVGLAATTPGATRFTPG